MGTEHEETQYLQIIFLGDFTNGKEIAQGFGHLHVINIQETVMHPVMCKFLVIAGFALGNFILVMREDQIFTTGMDINLFTKILLGHDRAFNMPARTAVSPW